MTRVTQLIHDAGKYLLISVYPLPTHPTHNFTHKIGGNLETLPGWPKKLQHNRPAQVNNFVPKGLTDNRSSLVQIMAWLQTGNIPLFEPMMAYFTDAYMCHSVSKFFNDRSATCTLHSVVHMWWGQIDKPNSGRRHKKPPNSNYGGMGNYAHA